MQRSKFVAATDDFLGSFSRYLPGISVWDMSTNHNEVLGVVFTGGEDINPAIYGREIRGIYFNRTRDITEKAVYAWAKFFGLPMLGVCRGHQFLNAMEGGSLTPHIFPAHGSHHEIFWNENHWIRSVLSDVNSLHHQGYTDAQAADTMIPMAHASDGIVEAARSQDGKILTVQFHPEFMGVPKFFDNWIKEIKC